MSQSDQREKPAQMLLPAPKHTTDVPGLSAETLRLVQGSIFELGAALFFITIYAKVAPGFALSLIFAVLFLVIAGGTAQKAFKQHRQREGEQSRPSGFQWAAVASTVAAVLWFDGCQWFYSPYWLYSNTHTAVLYVLTLVIGGPAIVGFMLRYDHFTRFAVRLLSRRGKQS